MRRGSAQIGGRECPRRPVEADHAGGVQLLRGDLYQLTPGGTPSPIVMTLSRETVELSVGQAAMPRQVIPAIDQLRVVFQIHQRQAVLQRVALHAQRHVRVVQPIDRLPQRSPAP